VLEQVGLATDADLAVAACSAGMRWGGGNERRLLATVILQTEKE
jgi:hypothetical protein